MSEARGSEARRRTLQRRALRRLSEIEVEALGIALEAVTDLEAMMVQIYPSLRRAAEAECRSRALRGQLGDGPFTAAFVASRCLVRELTEAREATTETLDGGRVPRRLVAVQ